MNAISLYVKTSRLVFQADPEDSASWADLFNLIPYLRQSLSCTVCGNLLIEPYTPTETNCQHHVCRSCKGGKKNLKPSCSWCKNYDNYIENVQLRILLQCYKTLCDYLASSSIYRRLVCNNVSSVNGAPTLIELIHEGSGFKDEFKGQGGLNKNTHNFVSSLYTSTSTQTGIPVSHTPVETNYLSHSTNVKDSNQMSPTPGTLQTVIESSSIDLHTPINHNSVYQVGLVCSSLDVNHEQSDENATDISVVNIPVIDVPEKTVRTALRAQSTRRRSRGPPRSKSLRSSTRGERSAATTPTAANTANTKYGCRCGMASAVPGKLTCCGQRCPCYIERKACLDCKCRGCRNPHTIDGHKVSKNFKL